MVRLLTILIPTWNRRKNLAELLAVLMPQIRTCPEVDVIISNNGSQDGTSHYLCQWQSEPRVRVVHQHCNLGANIHIAWLYGQAQGRFLWMIGDDDIMEGDLVGLVLQQLQARPEIGWLHLPGTHLIRNGSPLLTRCPFSDEIVPKARMLFPRYISWMGWVTSNVIRTKLLQAALPQVRLDHAWWPQDLLIRSIADAQAVALPLRKLTAGAHSTWAADSQKILMYQFPESILRNSTLTRQEIRACLHGRYADAPYMFRRLLYSNIPLFCRIAWRCPALLWQAQLVQSAIRRLRAFLLCGRQCT